MKTKRLLMGAAAALSFGLALLAGFIPSPYAIDGGGPAQKDMVVNQAVRNEVIDAAMRLLEQHYIFPAKAKEITAQLRAEVASGDYAKLTSATALADKLTQSLRRSSQDKHLVIRYFEQPVPARAPDQAPSAEEVARERFDFMRLNFGFEKVDRLKCNIGYIDLRKFVPPEVDAERIASAMALLGDTWAMIIDLRHNGGGAPDGVELVSSYFFDERTRLNDIYELATDRVEERWTSDKLVGRKYGAKRKLYILTSKDTFSAAEDFAYAMKNSKRATLVGETTGGGANAGNRHRLHAHFMMNVPDARPISPITKTNWEGVGVVPDIAVSASKALEVARVDILKNVLSADPDERIRARAQQCIAEL
jgi:C-terminal processing protease CtpA/Prc